MIMRGLRYRCRQPRHIVKMSVDNGSDLKIITMVGVIKYTNNRWLTQSVLVEHWKLLQVEYQ